MKTTNLYFSTYTNLNWNLVLEADEYKEIIADSLRFLVNNGRATVYGFVIMPNHVRVIWKINEGHKLSEVQRNLLKFAEQMVRFKILRSKGNTDPDLLFNVYDKKTQVWKRKGTSLSLGTYEDIVQKLSYIHKDPTNKKWDLCGSMDKYKYSSFRFYLNGDREFEFLTNISELECVEEESMETIGVAC
jgi:REP element-mobilizing transposase RayT